MDFPDQPREPGQEAVVVDAHLAAAMAPGLFRRGHLDRDEADPAARPRQVVGQRIVSDVALLVSGPRRHRRHDDAIADLDRADARRGEEDVHAVSRSSSRKWGPIVPYTVVSGIWISACAGMTLKEAITTLGSPRRRDRPSRHAARSCAPRR